MTLNDIHLIYLAGCTLDLEGETILERSKSLNSPNKESCLAYSQWLKGTAYQVLRLANRLIEDMLDEPKSFLQAFDRAVIASHEAARTRDERNATLEEAAAFLDAYPTVGTPGTAWKAVFAERIRELKTAPATIPTTGRTS